MQLRNGKQVVASNTKKNQTLTTVASDDKQSLVVELRRLIDECLRCHDTATDIEKMHSVLPVFKKLNEQSVEMLMGMDNSLKFASTIYIKAMELTCVLIERSYSRKRFDDSEKSAMIRMMSEMYRTRCSIRKIIWDGRKDKHIQDMMDAGDRHTEQIYRCLKHIVSDESESLEYKMYEYDDGEYTDVEIYDWHFTHNCDEDVSYDEFVNNADTCFGAGINRFNAMLWR